jgi:hypothetical protein
MVTTVASTRATTIDVPDARSSPSRRSKSGSMA